MPLPSFLDTLVVRQAGVYKEQLEEAGAALVERSCECDELRRKLEALEQEAASNLEELASDMQRHSTLSQSASASLAQQLAEAQARSGSSKRRQTQQSWFRQGRNIGCQRCKVQRHSISDEEGNRLTDEMFG